MPIAPEAYAGGAWLVGPFATEAEADAWAARRLEAPWVHDVVEHAGAPYADVFLGDPGRRRALSAPAGRLTLRAPCRTLGAVMDRALDRLRSPFPPLA